MAEDAGRARVAELVGAFELNRHTYMASDRKVEAAVRRDLVDPFFAALGWDVDNSLRKLPYNLREVTREYALRSDSGPRVAKPDYAFGVGGRTRFLVEAKDPSVDLARDDHSAFQIQSYTWSAGLPVGVLTDFEQFVAYRCDGRPELDGAAGRYRMPGFCMTYKDYIDRWDDLYALLSRDAVAGGSLDAYRLKDLRGVETVDTAFLRCMDRWRRDLAVEVHSGRPDLGSRALDHAVQAILDRIVFLRICEDREIENYGRLRGLLGKPGLYAGLKSLFEAADDRYNSGLFHFRPERERGPEDALTPGLSVSDGVLESVIRELYYPAPFAFAAMPADILGQVYERFLGRVVEVGADGSVGVEDKPEVKKVGGVFYTPEYVVEYIVENTLGPLLEGWEPGGGAALRVLDPACGSGAFLIQAYQRMLDWRLAHYSGRRQGRWEREGRIVRDGGGVHRLTLQERKRTLLDHVFGVDIDAQAVEVARLSLLLKCLEGETARTIQPCLFDRGGRVLPDLDRNVKCGNSLVGTDMAYLRPSLLVDGEEAARVNAFDWREEFPAASAAGGFDAVVGNPPYVRQESLGEAFKEYAKSSYASYAGTADLYVYFVEKAHRMLRPGGRFGFICSNKFMRANYGAPLRRFLARGATLRRIVDFGELPVFGGAATFPAVVLTENSAPSGGRQSFVYAPVRRLGFDSLEAEVRAVGQEMDEGALEGGSWTLAGAGERAVFEKMRRVGQPLGEYVGGKIFRGVLTGLNEAFVVDRATRDRLVGEDPSSADVIKPYAVGDDIRKYHIRQNDRFLLFARRGVDIDRYPAVKKHLEQFRDRLAPRPPGWGGEKWPGRKPGAYQWYEIQDTVDYFDVFEKPKIVFPDIAKESRFAFDIDRVYVANTAYVVPVDDMYLLGILNSKLVYFYFKRNATVLGDADKGGRLRWIRQDVTRIPVRPADLSGPSDAGKHARMVDLVGRALDLQRQVARAETHPEKGRLRRLASAVDRLVDALVYDLYGLTEGEVAVVEGRF